MTGIPVRRFFKAYIDDKKQRALSILKGEGYDIEEK
jgi:hypothetical protein